MSEQAFETSGVSTPPSHPEIFRGKPAETLPVVETMRNVMVKKHEFLPHTYSVRSKRKLSPRINSSELLATAVRLGGRVEQVMTTDATNLYGSSEIYIQTAGDSQIAREKTESTVVQLEKFGQAKLIGSPEANILILTTEGGRFRRGLTTPQMDAARKWMHDNQLNVKSEAPFCQYHLDPRINTESIAFILDQ